MSDPNQPPPPPVPVYATFVGDLNQASVKPLANSLTLVTQGRHPRLHLLIQSTGGTVSEGIYLYNFLRTFPVPITIYNGGSVCSAAVLPFLAVEDRRVSQTGAFMIHRCQASPQGANPSLMAAATDSLTVDDQRMDSILKEHLTLSEAQWTVNRRGRLTPILGISASKNDPLSLRL